MGTYVKTRDGNTDLTRKRLAALVGEKIKSFVLKKSVSGAMHLESVWLKLMQIFI